MYIRKNKNWIAELDDFHESYKFNRNFIQLEKIDGEYYVQLDEGAVYEVKHVYFTYGGNPSVLDHE